MKDRLKKIMKIKDLNNKEFAKKIGITAVGLSNYMNNERVPTTDVILKIKQAFNDISLDWLMTGTGGMFVNPESTVNNVIEGNNSGIVGNNTGHISFIQGLTTEQQIMQDNLSLQYEIKMKDKEIELKNKEIEILERDIASYRESLEQQKSSQELIKELYERKVEDLKRTINILETQMESNNKNQM